jgi:DNA-binding transcriptional MerR regulator
METNKTFSLDELCALTDLTKRTVRYYIQIGLLSGPIGETRAAHYLAEHLSTLLRIKALTESGISLERIREVLTEGEEPLPVRRRKPGSVDVRSHVLISEGVELQISPEEADLSPEQTRSLIRAILKAYQDIKEK